MKNNCELKQVCKAPGKRSLLQLFGLIILWFTFPPIAGAQSAFLDRASALFPISLDQNNPWPSYENAVIADFDGDNQLDRASIKFVKNGYEIDVMLSAHPGTGAKIFWSSREHSGWGAITCDIDQDGDQDVVLTSPTSLFPLAIWISDGTGHFQEREHAFYVPDFSNERHPTFLPSKKLDKQICFPRQRRDSIDLSRDAYKAANRDVSILADQLSLTSLPRQRAFSLPSRSPPKILFC